MQMEPLADLVRRLREQRGFRQRELAEKAGYGEEVVSKTEQGRGTIRSLTARAIFAALGSKKPLTEHEAHDFLAQCGLIEPTKDRTLPARELNDYVSEGLVRLIPEAPVTFRDLDSSEEPSPPIARLAGRLERAVGIERASHFLQVLMTLISPTATPSIPVLVKPPVQKDGYEVQEFVPVKPAAVSPSNAAAPRKRRSR